MYFIKLSKTLGIKPLRGLRARLTFVYSTFFGLFICVFAFMITRQSINSYRHEFDSALLNYGIDLSGSIKYDPERFSFSLNLPTREMKKEFPFILKKTYYSVRSIKGDILIMGGNPEEGFLIPYNPDLPKRPDYTHRFFTMKPQGKEYRVVNIKITNDKGQVIILQVATRSSPLRLQEERIILICFLLIPVLIALSSTASYIIAGRALHPIEELTRTANSIAASNLSLRVPEFDTGDEIYDLSRTFNDLLERLEKSFKAQENFVSNASHQLNTPLAIIKGELDVLESKERSLEDHEKFRRSLREELQRLITLVEKMLLISRVESGQGNFVFAPIRIDEVLLNSASHLKIPAREKRITIRFNLSEALEDGNLKIKGDKELLYCLFDNLLDNAIKYSPSDSVVSINIREGNPGLVVEITDEGPGIAADELTKILNARFQRGSKLLPGTGIGLSIAKQIAAYHEAKLEYRPHQPQGSIFIVHFLKHVI